MKWKSIKGYEGLYEVSDRGQVKALNFAGKGKSQLRKLSYRGGYCILTLWRNTISKTHQVHVLVLEAFVAQRPLGLVCDHIDRNKRNNHVSNLEWVTPKENTRRGKAKKSLAKIRKIQFGNNSPNRLLSEKKVKEIRGKYAKGKNTQIELSYEYGVSRNQINLIVHRKSWGHI